MTEKGECSEVIEELYTFLDGELTETKRATIQRHLEDCSPCLETIDFYAELQIVIAQRCRDEVPADLLRRVQDAIAREGGISG